MLLTFTVVVIENGYEVYTSFLVHEIKSFLVPSIIWHVFSNVCIIFYRYVAYYAIDQSLVQLCLDVSHSPTIYECEFTRNKVDLNWFLSSTANSLLNHMLGTAAWL